VAVRNEYGCVVCQGKAEYVMANKDSVLLIPGYSKRRGTVWRHACQAHLEQVKEMYENGDLIVIAVDSVPCV
jgi:hypothetical protein